MSNWFDCAWLGCVWGAPAWSRVAHHPPFGGIRRPTGVRWAEGIAIVECPDGLDICRWLRMRNKFGTSYVQPRGQYDLPEWAKRGIVTAADSRCEVPRASETDYIIASRDIV